MTGQDTVRGEPDQADPSLRTRFWILVLLAKVCILAIGFGVLLIGFTEYRLVGIAFLLISLGVAYRWIRTYRDVQTDLEDTDTEVTNP